MSRPYDEIPLIKLPPDRSYGPGLAEYLARMAEKHGPVFRRALQNSAGSPLDLVYLVGPEANRAVFHTLREHFSHDLGWTPIIGDSLGHGLLNMDPPEWNRHRMLMNPAFTSGYMARYLPVMQRVVAERSRDWPERDDVDLIVESREMAFDVAAASLVSAGVGAEVDRLRELFYILLHGFDSEEESWEAFVQRRIAFQTELNGLLLRLVEERRAAGEAGRSMDVLGMIVTARDEEGRALSDEQVLAHLNVLLVAGHETTTMLGAWVLYLLATNPAYLARVHAELDATLGGADAPLTFDAIKSTSVLGNAVKEAGRLESPVAVLPRGVSKSVEFGGFVIPAGAQVRLAIAATHRLPALFADPDRFDPDRFAPPRDEERRAPYALSTFGGGPRTCIGINFAQIEVKALAAHVLRRYTLEPLQSERPQQLAGITSFVPEGIHVRARLR